MSDRHDAIWRRILIVGAVAALVATIVACFVVPIVGQDSRVHLHWLGMFPQLVVDGTLYPRWLPESLSGFGSPAFYFYPPASYWLAAVVSLGGVTTPESLYAITSVIALLVSGAAAYLYLKEIASTRTLALLGGLVYCVFPYRIVDLFIRNAFSEHFAFVFIPLLLISVRASGNGERWRSAFWAAVSTGGLLLSSIPTAVIVGYTVPVLLWAHGAITKERRRSLAYFVAGSMIGVLVASIYVLPALEFRSSLSYANFYVLTGGKHSLVGYVGLELLINQSFRFFAWSLTSVFALAVAMLWIQVRRRSETEHTHRWIGRLLFFVILLQLPYILGPVVVFLPLMDLIKFVWRWYLWLPIIAAIILTRDFERSRFGHLLVAVSLLTSIGIGGAFTWSLIKHPSPRLEPPHESPEYAPTKGTLSFEQEVNALASHTRDQEVVRTNGSVVISGIERYDEESYFTASVSSESASLVLHRSYFPTWRLRDEIGVEYPVSADTLGRVTVTIPKGKRNYLLTLVESNTERISAWISGLGVLFTAVLGVFTVRERRRVASSPSPATSTLHNTSEEAQYPKSGS